MIVLKLAGSADIEGKEGIGPKITGTSCNRRDGTVLAHFLFSFPRSEAIGVKAGCVGYSLFPKYLCPQVSLSA
jgi:hypothetical protein